MLTSRSENICILSDDYNHYDEFQEQLPSNAKQVEDFLQFTKVIHEDQGFYVCKATNDAGVDLEVVQIIVKGNTNLKRQTLES